MTIRALAACLAALLLPSAAIAAGLPHYHSERSCADAARRAGNRDGGPPPGCVEAENDARDQAAQLWPRLSASAQQRCRRLSERRESYLILAGCLEREASLAR